MTVPTRACGAKLASVPPPPSWYAHLPAIRAALEELDTPALDRAMVEQLFALSRRGAIRLMAQVRPAQPPRHGVATVVARAELLGWIDRLLSHRPVHRPVHKPVQGPVQNAVQGALRRRAALRSELAAAAREAEARHTPVVSVTASVTHPAPAPTPEDPAAGWPEGIALAEPGLLTLRFASAEHLLVLVLALAEEAAEDYPRFQRRLERSCPANLETPQEPAR